MAQGKGILQPHHLIDEFDSVNSDDQSTQKLSDGPFADVIKSAQVNLPSTPLWFFGFIIFVSYCHHNLFFALTSSIQFITNLFILHDINHHNFNTNLVTSNKLKAQFEFKALFW